MKVTIRQKAGMHYLFADISVSSIRVKSSLGISVKDLKFNPKTQGVQGGSNTETNILINTMKTQIMGLIRDLQVKGDLTKQSIKDGILSIRKTLTNPDQLASEQIYFYDYAQMHIERSKPTRKSGTIKQCNVSLGKIEMYEKHYKMKLRFDHIDMNFYNNFVEYCTTKQNLSYNSISMHIKNIKMWMNASLEERLHSSVAHRSRAFKKLNVPADTIYLTEQELALIKNAILPTQRLENARDIFLLACYTGLRSQDYDKLNREHLIQDGTMLKIRTEKTDVEVVIPLHPIAKSILEKYNGTPRLISTQKLNEYIKEVCRIVGITEMLSISRTYGGKKRSVTKPKCDFVSSHTARRSFATNAFKAGLPTLSIMAITGHKTETVFLKYIRVSNEEHASLVSQHGFFRGKVA